MAGGPIFPHSAFPVTDEVFPNFHVGGGANSKQDEGLGLAVASTLAANATWRLRFQMPSVLPSGTFELRVLSLANATTGAIAWQVSWLGVQPEVSPSGATLVNEDPGNMTWGSGDADVYKENLVTLDADTVAADDEVVMDIVFEDVAGTTLAVVSTHIVSVRWV